MQGDLETEQCEASAVVLDAATCTMQVAAAYNCRAAAAAAAATAARPLYSHRCSYKQMRFDMLNDATHYASNDITSLT
jgi:hypothetical protein